MSGGGGHNISVDRTGGSQSARGTIVFVNSLATTTGMWDGVVTRLPKNFDVVRYDQRDRGGPMEIGRASGRERVF